MVISVNNYSFLVEKQLLNRGVYDWDITNIVYPKFIKLGKIFLGFSCDLFGARELMLKIAMYKYRDSKSLSFSYIASAIFFVLYVLYIYLRNLVCNWGHFIALR